MATKTSTTPELESRLKSAQDAIKALEKRQSDLMSDRRAAEAGIASRDAEIVQAYLDGRDPSKLLTAQQLDRQKIDAIAAASAALLKELGNQKAQIARVMREEFQFTLDGFNDALLGFFNEIEGLSEKFTALKASKKALDASVGRAGMNITSDGFPHYQNHVLQSLLVLFDPGYLPAQVAQWEKVIRDTQEIFKKRGAK